MLNQKSPNLNQDKGFHPPSTPIRLGRALSWLRRLARARRLGIPYTRDKYWQVPPAITLGGYRQLLSTPEDHGTRIAFKDIFLDDVYGLTRLKGTVKTVLDVGAHAGLFSLYSRILFPDARIHAYEPNPALWKHLTQQSCIGRFKMFPQAVGLNEGRVDLLTESDSVLTRTMVNPTGPVSMVSIQQALQQLGGAADILKLDCEGAEWEILKNKAAISAVRFLTLEYHLIENRSLDEMVYLLHENGLRIVFCHEDSPGNGRIWAVAQYDNPLRN